MDKSSKDYWKDFTPIWWGEFKSWFSWGNWRQTMTSLVFGVGLLYFLLFGEKFDLFMDDLIHYGISILIAFFWFFVVAFISFVTANIKLHGKQKDTEYDQTSKIIRLEKRSRNRIPIKTDKITITPKEEYPRDPKDGFFYAYLEVYNGEESDLLDCYANLTSIQIRIENIEDEEWGEYVDWLKGNTNELTWPNFDSGRDEKRIRRKKPERINVAKYKDGAHPIFIFADGTEEQALADRVYIEVRINGEIQKNSKRIVIEEILFTGFLHVHHGSYEQEGATITTTQNGESSTEVQPSKKEFYSLLRITPGALKK